MENQPTTIQKPTANKLSAVHRRSYGSVRIAFLNLDKAVAELAECAQKLIDQNERVVAVGLFGSLARGDALPSSDADLLIVLKSHPLPRWFDRIPEYECEFQQSSLPVELFPFTVDELARGGVSRPGFLRTGLRELVVLAGDGNFLREIEDASHPVSKT